MGTAIRRSGAPDTVAAPHWRDMHRGNRARVALVARGNANAGGNARKATAAVTTAAVVQPMRDPARDNAGSTPAMTWNKRPLYCVARGARTLGGHRDERV